MRKRQKNAVFFNYFLKFGLRSAKTAGVYFLKCRGLGSGSIFFQANRTERKNKLKEKSNRKKIEPADTKFGERLGLMGGRLCGQENQAERKNKLKEKSNRKKNQAGEMLCRMLN